MEYMIIITLCSKYSYSGKVRKECIRFVFFTNYLSSVFMIIIIVVGFQSSCGRGSSNGFLSMDYFDRQFCSLVRLVIVVVHVN